MQMRRYPEWKLQRFIGFKTILEAMSKKAFAGCKAALATALPDLQTLEVSY